MTNKYHSVKPILDPEKPKVFIETYGCQMNVNDSEVVLSILQGCGYSLCEKLEEADLIFINTCCYRDWETDRKSTRLNSSHSGETRMPSSA